jgi:hypothetical protein
MIFTFGGFGATGGSPSAEGVSTIWCSQGPRVGFEMIKKLQERNNRGSECAENGRVRGSDIHRLRTFVS